MSNGTMASRCIHCNSREQLLLGSSYQERNSRPTQLVFRHWPREKQEEADFCAYKMTNK